MNLLIGAAMFDVILFLGFAWAAVSVTLGLLIGKVIACAMGDDA